MNFDCVISEVQERNLSTKRVMTRVFVLRAHCPTQLQDQILNPNQACMHVCAEMVRQENQVETLLKHVSEGILQIQLK